MAGRALTVVGILVGVVLVSSAPRTIRSALSPAIVLAQTTQVASSAQADGSDPGAAIAKPAYSNASLKGTYAFSATNPSDENFTTFIGSYTADGLGHITAGAIKVSTAFGEKNPVCTANISRGTYSVEANGSGRMTLIISQAPDPCGGYGVFFCANGTYLIQVAQQGAAMAVAGNNEGCQLVGGSSSVEASNSVVFNSFRE